MFLIVCMFAFLPLLFWAWLNNESPLAAKDKVEKNLTEKIIASKSSNKLTKDQAMTIMMEHGFLPQLPAKYIPSHIIKVQESTQSHFQGVNYQHSGKPVILHFWATWCGPCKRELPYFALFASTQSTFAIYTITSELNNDTENSNKIWNFYTNHNISGLNVCADTNGKLTSLLNVSGIPATILISADGLLLGQFLGATDWLNPELAAALEAYVK